MAASPTVIHLTHEKAGSQWVYAILAAAAPGRIVRPLAGGAHVLEAPVLPGMVYPTAYVTREQLEAVTLPEPLARVAVIRDLRDTLISSYFSLRYSHSDLGIARLEQLIAALAVLPEQEGLRLVMHVRLPVMAAIALSWSRGDVPLVRFEELVADGPGATRRLLEHCRIELSDRQLAGILRATSFEARTGRPRGVEDVRSHERKGVVGDWRNHLHGDLLDEFKATYDDVLIQTGYEVDDQWGAGPHGRHRRRDRIERRCWCGATDLEPFGRGYRRCRECDTLVSTTAEPGNGRPAERGEPFWTEARFHHWIAPPERAWRGAPLRRPEGPAHPAVLERAQAILRHVPPGGRVLDAAAGPGTLVALLRLAGIDAVGLEASEWAASRLREDPGIPVQAGRIADATGSFDAIALVDALAHEPDPLGVLSAARAHLAPHGVVVVDQPLLRHGGSLDRLRELGSTDLRLLRPNENLYLLTSGGLRRLLARAGLTEVRQAEGTLAVAGADAASDDGAGTTLERSGHWLLEALGTASLRLALANRRLALERELGVRQLADALEAARPELIADAVEFGAGWHPLERAGTTSFRWAGDDAELVLRRPSGHRRRLIMSLEPGPPGPGRDFGSLGLELIDAAGRRLDLVEVVPGQATVGLRCPAEPGRDLRVRLRSHGGGGSAPGDSRVLNFRLFALLWD